VPPLRGGVLVDEQFEADRPVGMTLVQPKLRDADGRVFRLAALLGRKLRLC
jgi:hypothetical protein